MTEGEALQREVIEWVNAEGRGQRAASKEFNIPRATIQTWVQAWRAGRPLPRVDARTTERAERRREAKERAKPPPPPPKPKKTMNAYAAASGEGREALETDPFADDHDPATCSREEYLIAAIRRCVRLQNAALKEGHGGVARQWEISMGDHRDELDELRDQEKRAREAAGREEEPNPDDLADRLMRNCRHLVRLLDRTKAVRLLDEMCRAIGGRFDGEVE